MTQTGEVIRWDAERGFGFIATADGRRHIFFHVRDFRGGAAPGVGLRVGFEEIQVGGKGPRAMDVRPLNPAVTAASPRAAAGGSPGAPRPCATPAHRRHASRTHVGDPPAANGAALARLLMLGWLALLAWGAWSQRLPVWLPLGAVLLNGATYLAYAGDKRAAQSGAWRTPEQTLHLLALLGGWPAAWWAQQRLRHKSRKLAFRQLYWVTVLLHCTALALLVARPAWLPLPRVL